MKKETLLKKDIPALVILADDWFSRYIRIRDSDDNGYSNCISCGRSYPIISMDNGHYQKRQRKKVRYNEMNCHAQCKRCNKYLNGNMAAYRVEISLRYGEDAIIEIEREALVNSEYSPEELVEIITQSKERVKKMLLDKMFPKWW